MQLVKTVLRAWDDPAVIESAEYDLRSDSLAERTDHCRSYTKTELVEIGPSYIYQPSNYQGIWAGKTLPKAQQTDLHLKI